MATLQSPMLVAKLAHVRELLVRELPETPVEKDACLTCSFQAEDVLLLYLARELWLDIPVLFLDTGYHFTETYAYRDRIAADWKLSENKQRVRVYRLTSRGKKQLLSERSRWEQLSEAIAGVLSPKRESGV